MPLHPIAQAIIDQLAAQPPLHSLSPAAAREHLRHFALSMPPGEPVAAVEDRVIATKGAELPIRIYTPIGTGPFPMVTYFHSGGWTIGDLNTDDSICRAIVSASQCMVVSINYRHAPEYKFPVPVEDAYASVCWVAAHGAEFGGDPARLAVAGSSAGANLATVATLIAREQKYPTIVGQILQVPVTDYSMDSPSFREFGAGYGLDLATCEWFLNNYLRSPEDGPHEYVSPLRATNLSGLPPALIITAEFDPLRSEGEAYAKRLSEAGVTTTYKCKTGMMHLFLGSEATDDIAEFLRSVF